MCVRLENRKSKRAEKIKNKLWVEIMIIEMNREIPYE